MLRLLILMQKLTDSHLPMPYPQDSGLRLPMHCHLRLCLHLLTPKLMRSPHCLHLLKLKPTHLQPCWSTDLHSLKPHLSMLTQKLTGLHLLMLRLLILMQKLTGSHLLKPYLQGSGLRFPKHKEIHVQKHW
jgi:hypothetical protein